MKNLIHVSDEKFIVSIVGLRTVKLTRSSSYSLAGAEEWILEVTYKGQSTSYSYRTDKAGAESMFNKIREALN